MANFITRWFFVAALAMLSFSVAAADERSAKIVTAFEGWLKANHIKTGAIAVGYKGDVIDGGGKGRKIGEIAGVASLSKAITAACVTKALKDNGKKLSAPLSELIPQFLKSQKKPKDKRFVNISAEQLMVHNSGMKIDITQKELWRLKSMKYQNSDWQFKTQVKHKLSGKPGGKYIYNNMNYLILGLIIDEVTGEAYEGYCKREILAPLGIVTAKIDPEWRVTTAYAGWKISAEDYLKFAHWAFANNSILGKNPLYSAPKMAIGRGAYYGSGVLFRQSGGGYNFWHTGRWGGYRKKTAKIGAYFAVYANGYSVSLNYEKFMSRKQAGALDALIYKASH